MNATTTNGFECFCDDYEAGVNDQHEGRTLSPYSLIHLRHGSCYRAGQIDERRRQLTAWSPALNGSFRERQHSLD